MNMQDILGKVISSTNQIFKAEAGSAALLEPARNSIVIQAAVGLNADAVRGMRLRLDQAVAGWVIAHGQPALVPDVTKDDRFCEIAAEQCGDRARSIICVPLTAKGATIGAIELVNIRPDYLSEDGLGILKVIADQATLAIENARLLERTQRQAEEQSLLFSSMSIVTSDLALDTVLDAVSRQLVEALNVDICIISRWDDDTKEISTMRYFASPNVKPPTPSVRRLVDLSLSLSALEAQSTTILEINSPLLLREDIERLVSLDVQVLYLIPLVYGHETIGLVEIGHQRSRPPLTPNRLRLAEMMSAQAAVSIEHARLFDEAKRRLAEAQVLQEVMVEAASSLDFDEVLSGAIRALHRTLGVERLGIFLPEGDPAHIVAHATAVGFLTNDEDLPVPLEGSIVDCVYRTGEPVLVTGLGTFNQHKPLVDDTNAVVCVPVLLNGTVAAVLNAESPRLNAFDYEDLNLFKAIAAELAVALENATLFKGEHRLTRQQQALLDVFADLSAELKLPALFERIIKQAIDVIPNAEAGSLIVPEGEGFVYGAAVGFDLDALKDITFTKQDFLEQQKWIEQQGQDPPTVMRFGCKDLERLHQETVASVYDQLVAVGRLKEIKSSLRVTLVGSDQILGSINIDSLTSPNAFTESDEQTLLLFASQAAIAIQNARLFEEIRTAEAKYRDLFDNANDFIFTLDNNFRIRSANKVILKSTGYRLDEIIGLPAKHFVKPRQVPALFKLLKKHLSAKQSLPPFQLTVLGRHGKERVLEVTVRVQRRGGRPVGLHCIARDITQRRELERQLRQTEKLSTIGKLVAGVAHELNNPLTSIIGYASLLQESELPQSQQADLGVIFRQAERARLIVKDLLTFARKIDLNVEPVDINEIIATSLTAAKPHLRAQNIQVETTFDLGLAQPSADPHRLEQVFTNLITNAIQSMATSPKPGRLAVTTQQAKDAVRITIADNGPGIPEDMLHRIFDPFFSTKQVGEGIGLGLSICFGIISEHKGRIWAENSPTEGAIFYIELPLAAAALALAPPDKQPPAAQQAPPRSSGAQLDILAIDDEPYILKLLKRVLKKLGYTVETASNGHVALEKLKKQSYDLIICDIVMPDMSGPALYEHIKKEIPYLANKFIFITGNVVDFETQSFLKESGAVWFSKPFLPADLRQAVLETLKTEDVIAL